MTTWVRLDPKATPKELVALVKCEGRWVHAASWGTFDVAGLRRTTTGALVSAHLLPPLVRLPRLGQQGAAALPGVRPRQGGVARQAARGGQVVESGGAAGANRAAGKLLDGVAFMHDGGRVWWSHTTLVTPDGKEQAIFGNHEDRPSPEQKAKTRLYVAGLKKGAKVRVLFKDRDVVADDGFFVDDFRGVDLYQHFGGQGTGYGNAPVALHVYEIP